MVEIVQPKPSSLHAALAGNPPADRTRDGATLFQREVEAAVERAGGVRARDERARELSAARRDRREQGFERYGERVDQERRGVRPVDADRAAAAQRSDGIDAREPQAAADAARAPADGAAAGGADPVLDANRAQAPGIQPNSAPEDVARYTAPAPAAASNAPLAPQAAPQPAGAAHAPAGAPSAKAPTQAAPGATSLRSAERVELPASPRSAPAGAAVLERAEEILRQIRLAIQPNAKRVVLELEPRDLGRMSIRMSLHRGELATVVRVESPETLELLEQRAQELRSLLAERGFDATRTTLELGFGAQGHTPRRELDPEPARARGEATRGDARPPRAEPLPTTCPPTHGIDTYA